MLGLFKSDSSEFIDVSATWSKVVYVVCASFSLLKGLACRCEPSQCFDEEQVCVTLSQDDD